MSFEKLPRAEVKAGDPAAMVQAITAFKAAHARRPSPFHLKFPGGINYWPSTGKIFIDGAPGPHPDRGDAALLKLLKEQDSVS